MDLLSPHPAWKRNYYRVAQVGLQLLIAVCHVRNSVKYLDLLLLVLA